MSVASNGWRASTKRVAALVMASGLGLGGAPSGSLIDGLLPTTTTLTSSANPAHVGQVVTYSATVTTLLLRPGGTVTFAQGGTEIGSAGLNSAGRAAVTTRLSVPAGTRWITATYHGAALFASSSATISQTVHKVPTSTVVSAKAKGSESWSLAATVSPLRDAGQRVPGSVVFSQAGVVIGRGDLDAAGKTVVTASAPATTGRVTGRYAGSATFAESFGSATAPAPRPTSQPPPSPTPSTESRRPQPTTTRSPSAPTTRASTATTSAKRSATTTRATSATTRPSPNPASTRTSEPARVSQGSGPLVTRSPGVDRNPSGSGLAAGSQHSEPAGGSRELPEFASSVPTPGQVVVTPERIAVTGLLAALLLVYIAMVTTMFNQTLTQNYDRITAALTRLRLRHPWLPHRNRHLRIGRRRHRIEVAAYIAVCAALIGFIDPGFGLNKKTAILVAAMAIAVTVVTLTAGAPSAREIRTKAKMSPSLRLRVIALPVAVLCAGVSRLVGFIPGFAYGMVAGYMTSETRKAIGDHRRGQLIAVSAVAVFVVSMTAWLLWAPVHGAVEGGRTSWWWLILDTTLVSIFVIGLDGLAFQLLPIKPFEGARLLAWDKRAWVALQGLAIFGLLLVLLNPQTDEVRLLSRGGVLGLAILLGGFGLFSLSFWAWFRFRRPAFDPAVETGVAQAAGASRATTFQRTTYGPGYNSHPGETSTGRISQP